MESQRGETSSQRRPAAGGWSDHGSGSGSAGCSPQFSLASEQPDYKLLGCLRLDVVKSAN